MKAVCYYVVAADAAQALAWSPGQRALRGCFERQTAPGRPEPRPAEPSLARPSPASASLGQPHLDQALGQMFRLTLFQAHARLTLLNSEHRHAVHNLAPGVAVAVEVGDVDVIARAQRAKG